jgi:N-acyl-D-aspartate/D-glutamate deacylase
LGERAAALRDPARKSRILSERHERLAGDGTPIPPLIDILLARIELIAGRMFPLGAVPDYEPDVMQSFLVRARQRGVSALEGLYDHLAEGDGSNLIYLPIFNYNDGTLNTVHEMLQHPRALFGLADSGAHVGTVCDASFNTFMLTHWVRDRAGERLSLERAVEMMTLRNARYLGLGDRGRIAPGLRADLNLIDPTQLSVGLPRLVHDLPAGGKRFLQKGEGYLGTWVAGRRVVRDNRVTDERLGRLVRFGTRGTQTPPARAAPSATGRRAPSTRRRA